MNGFEIHKNTSIPVDTLLDYHEGSLTQEERSKVEAHLQKNPSDQWVLESIALFYTHEGTGRQGLESYLNRQTNGFQYILAQHQANTFKRTNQRLMLAAAVIALLITVGIVFRPNFYSDTDKASFYVESSEDSVENSNNIEEGFAVGEDEFIFDEMEGTEDENEEMDASDQKDNKNRVNKKEEEVVYDETVEKMDSPPSVLPKKPVYDKENKQEAVVANTNPEKSNEPVKQKATDNRRLSQLHQALAGAVMQSDELLIVSDDDKARLWGEEGEVKATFNHRARINSAVFSRNRSKILTASDDQTAIVWSRKGNKLVTLKGHSGPVTTAIFSPNEKYILTASDDKSARLWNRSGKLIMNFKHVPGSFTPIFSPDGSKILTCSTDKKAELWDVNGLRLLGVLKHNKLIRSAVFNSSSNQVLTASEDKTAKLWKASDASNIRVFKHSKLVSMASFSPVDDQKIMTASWDGNIRIWHANNSGMPLQTYRFGKRIHSAVFSSTGKHIVSIADDKAATIWSVNQTSGPVASCKPSTILKSATFSPDGKHVVILTDNNIGQLWNLQGKKTDHYLCPC